MSTISRLGCAARAFVRFRSKERGTRVKDRAKMARVKERGVVGEERFHFSRGQNQKSRSSIFPCSEAKQKRLLRRLSPGQGSWSPPSYVDLLVGFWLVFPDCGCCSFFWYSFSLFSRARSCLSYAVLSTAVACNVARPFSSQGKSFLLDVPAGTLRCYKYGLCNK